LGATEATHIKRFSSENDLDDQENQ